MRKIELYKAYDGKTFPSEEACLQHEKEARELEARLNDFFTKPDGELQTLINDLTHAKMMAYDSQIVDTMGTPQARALFYMKGVCQRFVDKYKDLRMI
jgi:hypothetical protein